MSWTPDQLHKHPKAKDLLGVDAKASAQAMAEPPGELSFTVVGDPMGKPRMTQRDRWMQRPAVLRYRDYCDRIKEAAPNRVLTADVYAVAVMAYLAMPKSWSQKKQKQHCGQMHRTKPDWDNIGKAVCDALFKDDSGIADGRTQKYWCVEGEQRTEVKISYLGNHEKSVL